MGQLMSDGKFAKEIVDIAHQWLQWQCKMISDVKLGAVFLTKQDNKVDCLTQWTSAPNPQKKLPPKLLEIATQITDGSDSYVCKEQCELGGKTFVCEVFSLPIKSHSQIIGSVSLMISVRSEDQKKAVLQLMNWGIIWLESLLTKLLSQVYKSDAIVHDVAKTLLQNSEFDLVGHRICNLIQKRFNCERVAFGLLKGLQVDVLSISEQLDFDKDSELIKAMELVMDESAEQGSMIQFSNNYNGKQIVFKHKEFSQSTKNSHLLSLPLTTEQGVVGIILLQREADKPFAESEIKPLESVANLTALGVQNLSRKRRFNMSSKKAGKSGFVSKILGMSKLSMVATAAVICLALLSVIQTDQNIYAKSNIVGSVQYQVVTPQEGYIQAAAVRAGDRVEQNQVMMELDTKDLKLERQRLESELSKATRSYQQALAMRERAKLGIALAERAQIQAKLDLVNAKLRRAEIRAPIDGLVVSGDFTQKLGAPVEKGQTLFELAPLENYRVILSVDEHDVAKIELGQLGTLRLAGMPYDPLQIKLTQITAQSEAKDGGNFFRIEADVSDRGLTITPGMQGVAQITVGEASILWVWIHSTVDRLRLWLWSLGV